MQSAFQGIGSAGIAVFETYSNILRVDSLVLAANIDNFPTRVNVVRPQALEPGDDCQALVTRQRFCESWHDTAKRDSAIRNRVIKNLERMVPGVCSAIERRRWIVPGEVELAPFGSSAAIGSMAGCTMQLIECFAGFDLCRGVPSTWHRGLFRRISGTSRK